MSLMWDKIQSFFQKKGDLETVNEALIEEIKLLAKLRETHDLKLECFNAYLLET